MNKTDHIDHILQDLLDGDLDEETAAMAMEHMAECAGCRSAWDSLRRLIADLRSLPTAIDPPRDLWKGIEARLAYPPDTARESAPQTGEPAPGQEHCLPKLGRNAPRHEDRAPIQERHAPPPERHASDHERRAPDQKPGAPEQEHRAPGQEQRASEQELRAHKRERRALEQERHPQGRGRGMYRRSRRIAVAIAAAVLFAAGAAVWLLVRGGGSGWGVESLDGAPLVARQLMGEEGVLRPGEWLETDDTSRARLRVGSIGEVDVEPNTRVQLRRSRVNDHRIALAEGRIDARIWAPPRLFFVETPSATAIDLGCAYTLDVDSTGKSILHVTAGYVELERDGRSSVVPAGTMCYATPKIGPGTVFSESASPALRSALERFDFEGRLDEDLSILLAEARPDDAVTLWQLVEHSDGDRRERIYLRLVDLIHPPAGVTREGVLGGDEDMFAMWRLHLGLDAMSWWGYLREKVSFRE